MTAWPLNFPITGKYSCRNCNKQKKRGPHFKEIDGERLGGKIFMTSLSHEDEARLQAALSASTRRTFYRRASVQNCSIGQDVA